MADRTATIADYLAFLGEEMPRAASDDLTPSAFALTVIEFRTESHLVIDCLTAGVIKILRSLLPFPIMDKISEVTSSIFNDSSSDNRKAQFRKIVIIQFSRAELELDSISKRTDSSRVRHRTLRLGCLGVSNSSAILLFIRWGLVLWYFHK
jgi:hypothetical protein